MKLIPLIEIGYESRWECFIFLIQEDGNEKLLAYINDGKSEYQLSNLNKIIETVAKLCKEREINYLVINKASNITLEILRRLRDEVPVISKIIEEVK